MEIKNWVEAHRTEAVLSSLALMLMIAAGKCFDLNRKCKTLECYAINAKNEASYYMKAYSDLKKELYSLAGEAVRCGSSIGGQILNTARKQ